MRQTATLKSLSGNLGRSVKIILTLLFLNFFTQNISAQIVIDGNAADWGVAPFNAAHVQDVYNAGNTDNIFAGNEKDFFFAANWFWKLGGAKDKNEIANGAAALVGSVTGPSGTIFGKFLVFAGDRTSNNGDAQIGFWFFQDGTGPIIAAGDVHTFYPEKHSTPAPGDLLVLADFSAGGREAAVTVLQWVGTGGTFPNTLGRFNQIGATAAVGTNNSGFTAVPAGWSFEDKQQDNPNPTTQYSPNEFYEGYVDLSIFGANAIFCPSTWLLETRSTKEITSTLDDFVGGALAGAPNCSITGNATICQGSSTCFTASGGPGNFTYSWSGPAGSGFTATGAVVCNLTAAGAYSVTVLNPTGCTSVCSQTLIVNNTPVCNILPANQTICSYQTASFTATGGGTYLWSTGATTAVISNLTAAGTYSVTVTGAGGCKSSCSRTLAVVNPPSCNILPGNQSICAGGSASFTATGGGTYLWSTGATTASISNVTAAGTYSVTVTGAGGCTSSCSRTLTVTDPPSCNILPANQTICSYQTASFTATGGGTYLWSTGATTASISNLTTAGTYSVTVTGAGGCTSSCSRTLAVTQPPVCNILPGNQTICAGNSASFTATGGGTYLWSTGATTASISNVTAAGTYSVTVTGAGGCTSSCSRTLEVVTNPVCNILPGNQTICAGRSASFTATGGSSYLWSTGATTAVISNITAAGTYSVTVTAGAGCSSSCSRTLTVVDPPSCNILPANQTICSYQTASFTATGGGTYLWSTGSTSAIISNLTAAGTYSVTVTGAFGCTSSCSRTLVVNNPPDCNILPGNQTICAGSSASFTATGGTQYRWSTGATTASISNVTAAGTYSVTVTAATGCTSACSRTLTVNQLPSVDAGTAPAAQCRAAVIQNGSLVFGTNVFSVTGTVNAFTSNPVWTVKSDGGYNVSIVSPNSLTTNVNVSGNKNGPGAVTLLLTGTSNATPSCGTATDDVVLTIYAVPDLKPVVGSDFCPNVTTTGSVSLLNSQLNVSYQLKDDGNLDVQAAKAGTGGTLTWFGLAEGNYTVVGTFIPGLGGCDSRSGPGSVIENPLPEVSITAVPDQCNNTSVCAPLTALPSGGTFSGTGVTGTDFCANGLEPGPYTVTYSYTNVQGCTASSSIAINVIACQAALCTYTQGYFGNYGGTSCDGTNGGLTTVELIEQSLSNWGGTLTLGATGTCSGATFNRTMTITNTTAQIDCIIDKLPGGGPSKELSGASTICSFSDLKNGRINNVLLAQTLALGLNIGIGDPQQALGDFPLQAGCLYTAKAKVCGGEEYDTRWCEVVNGLTITHNEYENRCFSQALIDVLDQYYTTDVSGLFALANDALGNKDCVAGTEHGLSLSEIAGAAGSINEVFDECRIAVGWNLGNCVVPVVAPPRITANTIAEASTVGKLKVSTFPNPFRDQVRFVIQSPVAGQAVLEVYNVAGQKLETLYNGRIEANETRNIDYKPKSAASSMMIYRLRIGNQTVSGKLIGLTQ